MVLGGQVATRILKGRILAQFLLYLKQIMRATAESPDLAAAPAPQRPGRCMHRLTQQDRGGDSKCMAVRTDCTRTSCRKDPLAQHVRAAQAGGAKVHGRGAAHCGLRWYGVHNPGGLSRAVRVLGPGHSATIKTAQTTGKLESSTSSPAHLQGWKGKPWWVVPERGPHVGCACCCAGFVKGGHNGRLHAVVPMSEPA